MAKCLQPETGLTSGRSGRRGSDQRGAQLVEAALVLPILLTLVIGIVWMGRAYNTSQTLTRAAREGARFAVAPSCASCGNVFPADSEIRAVVDGALSASNLDPAQMTNFTVQRNVVLNPGGSMQESGVVVSFDYPFQFVIPFTSLNFSTITINGHAQMREEN